MGKFSYTWSLMGASFDVLKRDRRLLIFPALSGISCMLVAASFVGAAFYTGQVHRAQTQAQEIWHWILLFCFYFTNYFIITFFNVGVVAFAISRMAGGEPTIAGAFREALNRIHLIAAWALLAATVGVVLRVIESRSGRIGKIVTMILGSAWSVLTFLVVPVVVMEDKGPIGAFKSSTLLLRKTWGERLIGNFSFGLIFFLLNIPGVVGIIVGLVQIVDQHETLGLLLIILSVFYFIALALVHSVLVSVFQAALYLFTQGVKDEEHGFPVRLLQNAMVPR